MSTFQPKLARETVIGVVDTYGVQYEPREYAWPERGIIADKAFGLLTISSAQGTVAGIVATPERIADLCRRMPDQDRDRVAARARALVHLVDARGLAGYSTEALLADARTSL